MKDAIVYTITDKDMVQELEALKSEWEALKKEDSNYPNKEEIDKWLKQLEKKINNLKKDDNKWTSVNAIHTNNLYATIKHVMSQKEELNPEELFIRDNEAGLKKLFQKGQQMEDCEYWDTLRYFYQMMEDFSSTLLLFKKAFRSDKGCKEKLMEEDERAFLSNLPEEITIYRGMSIKESESEDYGISWTLSKERAEFFAYKRPESKYLPEEKTVVEKIIPKEEVIAYFSDRNEEEIIWVSD